jgi:hypothetical protein
MRTPFHRRAALFRTLCFASALVIAGLILGTRALTIHDIQIVPTVSYLAALIFLGQAFGEIASGRGFRSGALRGLRWSGAALTFGGLYATFIVPMLKRALTEAGPDKFFDPSSLLVVFVGAALVMLANLLADAGALEAELEQFF